MDSVANACKPSEKLPHPKVMLHMEYEATSGLFATLVTIFCDGYEARLGGILCGTGQAH